ncbi:MAG: hypothetical protein DRJ44_02340, partial [Thermoprotei archaeon]
MNMGKLWSYILPLPIESVNQLKVLLSVFSSEISINILKNIKLEGRTYQKDLLERLPYSSKTVILKLKQLVSAGVLEEGVEQRKTKGKTVWVKWYTPTFIGKWIITMLTPAEEVNLRELDKISKELFKMYSSSLAELCLAHGLSLEEYHRILDEEFLEKAPLYGKYEHPDVVVFDTLNICLEVYLSKNNIKNIVFKYGGPSLRLSTLLNSLGVKTILAAKFSKDENSRRILDSLVRERIGFAAVYSAKPLPYVIRIIDERGEERILSEKTGLTLKSPAEIDWNLINDCKIIYAGEIHKEIAKMVFSYAKTQGKIVVYRPCFYYLKCNIKELEEILEYVDIFIIHEKDMSKIPASNQK